MEATQHAAIHAGNHLCARESVVHFFYHQDVAFAAHSKKIIHNLSKKLYIFNKIGILSKLLSSLCGLFPGKGVASQYFQQNIQQMNKSVMDFWTGQQICPQMHTHARVNVFTKRPAHSQWNKQAAGLMAWKCFTLTFFFSWKVWVKTQEERNGKVVSAV